MRWRVCVLHSVWTQILGSTVCPVLLAIKVPSRMALGCRKSRKSSRHVVFFYSFLSLLWATIMNHFSILKAALVVGVWTIQSLQRQDAHLPQVCWVCVPGSSIRGLVQMFVQRGLCGWWLLVWWRLWSGWLAQQQTALQTECNLPLSKGKKYCTLIQKH